MQIQIIRQMNAILLLIICIPLIEIYLLIKVGGMVGAFNTIFLIFFTAITGVYFARLAGLNAIRSGFNQLIKNEVPVYVDPKFDNYSSYKSVRLFKPNLVEYKAIAKEEEFGPLPNSGFHFKEHINSK